MNIQDQCDILQAKLDGEEVLYTNAYTPWMKVEEGHIFNFNKFKYKIESKYEDIKSKKDLALRLINGQRFKTKDGGELYFDEDKEYSPFRYKEKEGSCTLTTLWNSYKELELIQPEN